MTIPNKVVVDWHLANHEAAPVTFYHIRPLGTLYLSAVTPARDPIDRFSCRK